ncbi:MAG: T9SS type A sorting domain-containing protein, partial [Candidatus Kapabacteria bacterium]|nr:T9SS type A sorting domain-containing protein [Candidatus Kapabacteria bacterium]
NSNGCENTSDALNFTISSVIEDGETAGLVLQPNPATDNITFSIVSDREEIVTISILNLTGQEVIRKDAGAESGVIKHTLNLADVASGVYTLRLQIGSRVIARTFVVQK